MAGKFELPFGGVKFSANWSLCFLPFANLQCQNAKESFSVLDVAGMVFQDFLAQMAAVQMHVDFGGADVFVAEHGLDGAEVGSALEQMGGKGVT